MCRVCGDKEELHEENRLGAVQLDRRKVMTMVGAGILGASAMAAMPASAATAATTSNAPTGTASQAAFKTKAWGVRRAGTQFEQLEIERRALRASDVHIEILYAAICHSDIHGSVEGSVFPLVPGHENVGRVIAVGNEVTKFKVGDLAGVGVMVDSCRTCKNCLADREQNCLNGQTWTYGMPDKISGGITYGGYSKAIVVKEHFAFRIPPGANLPGIAPMLCAGITTFSPLQHWDVQRGQRVGVIGLGGLGHLAVKLAVARGADVTVFTTSPSKVADARRMGARDAILWSDTAAMSRLGAQFDFMISTVPETYPIQQFMDLLKLDATLVNVGVLGNLTTNGLANIRGRRSLAGSLVGGVAETQEVIDYCASRNIIADVQLIKPSQIAQAYRSILAKEARYRFVIDMTAA